MNVKKRTACFLSLLAVSVLTVLLCTACMTAEEKEKAREDIKAATPVVEKYLTDNFGGGEIVNIDFMQARKIPVPCLISTDIQAVTARQMYVLKTGIHTM